MTTTPLRVLYCLLDLSPGGAEKQLAAMIEHFDRARIEPIVCTMWEAEGEARVDCERHVLHYRSLRSPSIFKVRSRLRKLIVERDVHVVQSFFQDPTIVSFLGSRGTSAKLIGGFRDVGFSRKGIQQHILKRIYPSFDAFIANSRAVADNYSQVDGIPRDKISVIYNGVEMPQNVEVNPAIRDWVGQRPVVGIVANLNRRVKRVDLFIKAAGHVLKKRPDAGFVIVGGGELQPELEQLASQVGAAEATRFVGRVPDPLTYIAGFDMGVICSDSEGFSNAVLEYMASGVPVILTRSGGNAEALHSDDLGQLIDIDDEHQLADAMLHYLESPDRAREVGRNGLAEVEKTYTFARCAEAHEDLYRRTVEWSR